jgi:hypothetical protein
MSWTLYAGSGQGFGMLAGMAGVAQVPGWQTQLFGMLAGITGVVVQMPAGQTQVLGMIGGMAGVEQVAGWQMQGLIGVQTGKVAGFGMTGAGWKV